jgi:DNA-binding transcriptional ArsR family regulator
MPNRNANAQLRHAAPVFAALGDDVRLALVARLSQGEPLSITRLSEELPMTRQAVTKHLHVLADAGLITPEKSGREQMWMLKPDALQRAQDYLDIIHRQWGDALGRLKAFIEDERRDP